MRAKAVTGPVTEALAKAAASRSPIAGDQLHSLLALALAQEPLAENADLRAAAVQFEKHKGVTFLPLLNLQDQSASSSSSLPLGMAGGQLQASALAGVLEDLGYACTQSDAAFQDVLGQVQSVDEASVASMLGMMIRTHNSLDDRHGTQVTYLQGCPFRLHSTKLSRMACNCQ